MLLSKTVHRFRQAAWRSRSPGAVARRFGGVTALVVLMGCGSEGPVGPPSMGIGPSIVEIDGRVGAVVVPPIVAKGEPVIAMIETFAGPGIANRPGYVNVEWDGRTVTLSPFDDYSPGPVFSMISIYEHEVDLTFPDRGDYLVRVVGRRDLAFEEVVREYRVSVR